ncbi:MAG: alpha/beta fold hydrolase [Clostridia bacterium]|nr:alpha/beta fold hydrolase [Clostridia bacterium]
MRNRILILLLLVLLPLCAAADSRDIAILSRGMAIPATLTLPESMHEPCPIVLMAHGHGGSREENRGFGAIAHALAQAGVGSIRMDFAGCGESMEDFTANCLTTMKQDMLSAMDYAVSQLHAPQIGLFGYSMGGRVVLELLAEGTPAHAAALLAPANDLNDLIETAFEDFAQMYEAARRDGFYPYRENETLSLSWFEDLLRYDDPAAEAAKIYKGPALVAYAEDDYVVRPQVCRHVADVLDAHVYDATGKGHIYGFWLDEDPLRERIAAAVAGFFRISMK